MTNAGTADRKDLPSVVLVHGGFVDGSGWEGVHRILKKDGYTVSIVQNPTTSLEDDVAATRRALAAHDAPVILVGHSYGGVVITEAGTDPRVAGLVYIAAFAPDKGESVSALIKDPPPGAPAPPILPPQEGYLFLDKAKFRASFAADVDAEKAAFMADAQVPWGVAALAGTVSLEDQAELVSGRHGRHDDPTCRTALHVGSGGCDSRRGCGQSLDLRVAARRGGGAHQHSGASGFVSAVREPLTPHHQRSIKENDCAGGVSVTEHRPREAGTARSGSHRACGFVHPGAHRGSADG